MLNALSVDVEDYFMVSAFEGIVRFEDWHRYESRVERNTLRVLDLLNRFGAKATFFVLGWVAEHHPSIVLEIKARGHEIATHGYNHRIVYRLTPDEFRQDVRKAKRIIEDLTGERVFGYRAPSYSITEKSLWALDILIEEGFEYDSSIFPIHHDRYGYPGFNRFAVKMERDAGVILELPLSTKRILGKNFPIAGGGYLRLFPAKLIEWGIRSLNEKERQPAIVYFHPWEIDPGQPRLPARAITVARHTVNLDKMQSKLERLLGKFRFGTLRQAFGQGRLLSLSA